MFASPLAKKVLIITLLLLLFPVLLKIGFYLFLLFLFAIPVLWIALYIVRQKILANAESEFLRQFPFMFRGFGNAGQMRRGPEQERRTKEEIVIDVTAERR